MNSDLINPNLLSRLWSVTKQPKSIILIFFAVIYSLISLVNHYNYRTYAFDLGIYNNCLYQYGHFHKNHYPYLHYMFTNFLSDHFSLYTVILSPLYYIFGSYTLLYIQILSILFGALGVYKIVVQKINLPYIAELAMIQFLAFFGIYSALSFDYHDNVVSAMLVPWFIYYFNNEKRLKAVVLLLLIVIGKENMPIWLAFVCAGLFLANVKNKSQRNFALMLSVFCLIYTIIIIKFVMPAMDPLVATNGYNAFKYSFLGSNGKEIIHNLTHYPWKIFKGLFINHLPDSAYDKIKFEFYICMLFSGLWLLILKPQYLIMMIPIIAQKVYNDDFGKWGINAHYSIELAPILVIGIFESIAIIKNKKLIYTLALIATIGTIYITLNKINTRESLYYNNINTNIFIPEHYASEFNKSELKRIEKLIPKDANLSCSNMLAPHLSFRKNIYQFPDVHDADYILIANSKNSYPIRDEDLTKKIQELKDLKTWELIAECNQVYLFRRKLSND